MTREVAIEERNNKLRYLITCMKCEVSGRCCDENCPTQYHAGNMGEIMENLEEISKILEKEPKWIPCSERLPKESSRYLVTRGLKDCNNLWNRVYIVNYSDLMGLCKEKVWWSGNVGKSDFETYDDVLAWMPLPKPYREERRTDE